VVNQSLVKMLVTRKEELLDLHGFRPRIVAVVDRGGAAVNPKGLDLATLLRSKAEEGTVAAVPGFGHPSLGPMEVIRDVAAEAVVEATPTDLRSGEPAISHIKAAFMARRHVVTSNKGPLALALPTLEGLAKFNHVSLRFSGTVGGGTPVLEIGRFLQGDRVLAIRGILNGTTNYVLTEMDERGISFDEALAGAQELGYAEADPSGDVDGVDSAAKLVILANWTMKRKCTLKDVDVTGIRGVTLDDMRRARAAGRTIKLLATIDGGLKVRPTEMDRQNPLAVSGVLNAVTFVSEFAGEETIVGRGAGGPETASAILRDLIEVKQTLAETTSALS
jgi:homoserine dehydrogenase